MDQFLMIIKGKGSLDYSPEELNHRLEAYQKWVSTIQEHHLSDNRLENQGAHLKKKDQIQTDGPFLEAKEIIAGYVLIQAKNLDEAISIANSCPLLEYFEIMVRPVVKNS